MICSCFHAEIFYAIPRAGDSPGACAGKTHRQSLSNMISEVMEEALLFDRISRVARSSRTLRDLCAA